MGGLDSIVSLLWSLPYIGILILSVAGIVQILRSIAPQALAAVGVWNAVRGGALALCWALLLSLVNAGPSMLALQAFAMAAYFGLISIVVLCLPVAVLLVRLHRYSLPWFVGGALAFILLVVLVAEVSIGPEPGSGFARWSGSIFQISVGFAPAFLAFGLGARMPMRRAA